MRSTRNFTVPTRKIWSTDGIQDHIRGSTFFNTMRPAPTPPYIKTLEHRIDFQVVNCRIKVSLPMQAPQVQESWPPPPSGPFSGHPIHERCRGFLTPAVQSPRENNVGRISVDPVHTK